jgi:hypothetical protein
MSTTPPFSRNDYRQLVDLFAERARAILPECRGRIENAIALVLHGDVELIDAETAVVHSSTHPSQSYRVNGTCSCQDYPRAPSNWCKHRISAGLQRRVEAVLQGTLDDPRSAEAMPTPQDSPAVETDDDPPEWQTLATTRRQIPANDAHGTANFETSAPGTSIETPQRPDANLRLQEGKNGVSLPESPVSLNTTILIEGRACQLTLRGVDETAVLTRMATILRQYPAPVATKPASPPQGEQKPCPVHGSLMRQRVSQKTGKPYHSHKTTDGQWCYGR